MGSRRKRISLRPSTQEDFDRAIGEPLPFRCRGFTAELDGKILGLGGLGFFPSGVVAIYLLVFDGYQKFPVTLHKAARQTLAMAKELGIREVVSYVDETFPGAARWHERLGFKAIMNNGHKVYTWTRSR